MSKTSRRRFLKMAGIGTAVAAGAAIPPIAKTLGERDETITVHAIGGVPAAPLPSYASYVLQGYVDPARKNGMLTRTVMAGAPDGMSDIALPGLSQTLRVTGVAVQDGVLAVHSLVADRSQLLPSESDEIDIWIDRATRSVRVRSGTNEIKLQLQP